MASSYGAFTHILCLGTLLDVGSGFVEFPASCLGQEDGYQWLKPLEGDEHPPINQKCVNEYMVIDLERDQNVQHYFSSFDSWHYALRGPALEDSVNWEEWWLPNAQLLDDDNAIITSLSAQIEEEAPSEQTEEENRLIESDDDDNESSDDNESGKEEVEDVMVRVRSKMKVQKLEAQKAEQQQFQILHKHHILKPLALSSSKNAISNSAKQSEYFSYILSPDCTSCDVVDNMERNELSWSNDDEYGDRTAYYMTSSMFGCDPEPQKWANCAWDEERYQCSFCTDSDSDGDLGYRRTRFPEQYQSDDVDIGLCGLYPQSSYSGNVAEDRRQWVLFNTDNESISKFNIFGDF